MTDDDVLGLGNEAVSGTKRKSPGDYSEEEKEKEDEGFQVESPEKEKSPDNKRARTEEENRMLLPGSSRQLRQIQCFCAELVSIAWQIAGSRYEDSKLVKKSASNSNKDDVMLEEEQRMHSVPHYYMLFLERSKMEMNYNIQSP
ncbi:uncharacterized protein DS421_19g636030 [Arachis hypogaea]|uniref:Uncharacterized protein n=1 Tax=Arachis hypogaea TaxID=3818 RepID=A0A6B9V4H1_ARAHY|nr:uncharacterized protein DS421_19g636030 [Arachis hypogaea]